ncbi:MAG: hypothetical protein JWO90_2228 [Solirubrobacterales bacterium]|jgi:hypothetical protein|nr:hypothetical protein [Solirubrobacterales bacterium]
MTRIQLPVGASALLLGLLVALAGSFTDNLLGGAAVVTVLQVVLWIAGGILMLAGAASTSALRLGGNDRPQRRRGGRDLRPTVR